MQGILMTPEMLQATIEGRKTRFTEVIKPQPILETMPSSSGTIANTLGYFWKGHYIGNIENLTNYARYHVGETVYIKEEWCPLITPVYNLLDPTIPTVYKQEMDAGGATLPKEFKWKSPRSMPEWAARHFILIEAVRAERLQEISSGDCLAEGITASSDDGIGQQGIELDYKFSHLWDSINPAYPFDSNPWVCVYQFRLEMPVLARE